MKSLLIFLSIFFIYELHAQLDSGNHFSGHFAGHNNSGNYNIFFGRYIAYNNGYGSSGSQNSFFGSNTARKNSTGSENSFFGSSAGYNNTSGHRNSFFGRYTGLQNTTGRNNSFYGEFSGFQNKAGVNNSFFGKSAGGQVVSGGENSIFGAYAGAATVTYEIGNQYTVQSGDYSGVCAFGYEAGRYSKINYNSYFGYKSGRVNTGSGNSFFGARTGEKNSSGHSNSFFGYQSGKSNTTGHSNVYLGDDSGPNNSVGNNNTFLGASSGLTNTGSNNTFIGNASSVLNASGKNNTAIGHASGIAASGNGNIFIGNQAGPFGSGLFSPTFVNNTLYIDNEINDDPLIYGEFDNDFVKINGTFEVTAGLSNPSDVNLKNNFEEVDASDILDKIDNLPITKWTYKNRQTETHIGATAQDFHTAFGLGTDDKHISTIDADGVALAAIKALKKENDFLKEKINIQQSQIERLFSILKIEK